MKAILSNYRQSPRKVRLVADLIRGKSVDEARLLLRTLTKRASYQIDKLLNSAVANANSVSAEHLIIKEIQVNKGPVLKRFRPVAFGRAHPIHKHTSHIMLFLGEKAEVKTQRSKVKSKIKKSKVSNSMS